MAIGELGDSLLRSIEERMAAKGFKRTARDQSFVRAIPGGRMSMHLAFIDHRTDFDVTMDLAVRFDAVEDMINEDSTYLSKKEKTQTYSLGVQLGNLVGKGQMRWSVKTAADVLPATNGIVAEFEKYGLPYLERVSSMRSAFELLTSPGEESWIHSPIHSVRAKRVLAMAKILGMGDRLAPIASEYERFLEELKDFGAADFKRFAARIVG